MGPIPKLVVLRGLPGVGKTTVAEKVSEMTAGEWIILDPDRINFNSDEFRDFLIVRGRDVDEKYLPYRYLLYRAGLGLGRGKNVLWCQAWSRLWGIERAVRSLVDEVGNLSVFVVELFVNNKQILKVRLEERKVKGENVLSRRTLEEFISSFEKWSENSVDSEIKYLRIDGIREPEIISRGLLDYVNSF